MAGSQAKTATVHVLDGIRQVLTFTELSFVSVKYTTIASFV